VVNLRAAHRGGRCGGIESKLRCRSYSPSASLKWQGLHPYCVRSSANASVCVAGAVEFVFFVAVVVIVKAVILPMLTLR
jgi:hypothetical protein